MYQQMLSFVKAERAEGDIETIVAMVVGLAVALIIAFSLLPSAFESVAPLFE